MQSRFIFFLITRAKIVIYTFLTAAVLLFAGCGSKEEPVFIEAVSEGDPAADRSRTEPEAEGPYTEQETEGADRESRTICVFVCGAVVNEGVYELPKGSRVIDAVNAAGGYSEEADKNYVNQALYVTDTERVEIPTSEETEELRKAGYTAGGAECVSEAEEGSERPADRSSSSGRININTAGRDELMTLPGIGENKASKIIEYRESHGRFGAAEEIMNVSGIGSSVYDKMKDHITVE